MSEDTLTTFSDDSVSGPTNSTNVADVTSSSSAAAAEAPAKTAYVPPHLRYPPPRPKIVQPYGIPQQYFPASAIFAHYGVVHGGTINPSINNHRELAYILIFLNQHPEYPNATKIFVKSNLNLIFKRDDGEELNPLLKGLLIPLFEEERRGAGAPPRAFRFRGWVRVADAKRLVQGSDELIDMLTMKWRRDTPRGMKLQMLEREREEARIAAGEVTVTTTVEKGVDGEDLLFENRVFRDDPDDDLEDEEAKETGKYKDKKENAEKKWKRKRSKKVEGATVEQKLENTIPRSELAWQKSLGVDWAVVTLEFVDCDKGNPLHGPPVKLTAPAFVDFDDAKYNEKPQPDNKKEKKEVDPIDDDIEELVASTISVLSTLSNPEDDEDDKPKKKEDVPARGMDGADDTVLVNDDLDSASIPSSPALEPATPKKGSAVNLSTYALAKSWDDGALRLPEKNGLAVSNEDISGSYISAGASSAAEDFAAETDAEESDRWSELSEHEREDEHWMAVERGGMAKEVF
ncbi:hypothetical protein ABW21_db0204260 [Orbilia brochopaga]|nr:hypothetical protein ABW21_db0204260 [Drechslerella brochopaga]